ncbi:MAG: response regulator [Thermodesulfobacteriota bacterium]
MGRKILIVEDNEINRLLMKDVLAYHGYEIFEAANGADGLEKAKACRPDLILMDMQMPVMDGFAAVTLLKADPETRNIKVICITSFAMKGDRERILEAGCDDYVAKPINTRELPKLVKHHLEEV